MRAGYVFTMIGAQHMIRAGKEANWDIDKPPLREMLAVLGDVSRDRQQLVVMAAAIAKAVWQERFPDQRAQTLTIRMLEYLIKIPGGDNLIGRVQQLADVVFGLDVMGADAFRRVIKNWREGRTHIIIPRMK
jgi:hypothetical protein